MRFSHTINNCSCESEELINFTVGGWGVCMFQLYEMVAVAMHHSSYMAPSNLIPGIFPCFS